MFATAVDKWREELINTGRQEGLQKGRQEGIQEGILHTAQEMLKAGADIDFVQRVTNLSRQKILQIKRKIRSK